jgi:MtN3 and saliva related transmembrane protein
MLWENLWPVVGLTAAALTSTAFIPQLILRIRNPDQARVAYGTIGIFMLGASLWATYGAHLQDWIIIGANIFILLNLGLLAVVQFIQEKDGRKRARQ